MWQFHMRQVETNELAKYTRQFNAGNKTLPEQNTNESTDRATQRAATSYG
jgi:hypothetical protein